MHRLTILLALALLASAAPQAERLHSPWDDRSITATDAPYQCPAPPEFAKILDAEPYYTDSHASVIDPVKKAAYEKASDGSTHLGQYAGLAADAYLSKGSRAAAACVYSLLDAAAKADAWAGEMPHFQDVYIQNWILSGTAIPYLKVRNSGAGTPQQDAEIQQWFRHLAQRVQTYFDKGKGHPKSDAYNNHLYWAGLALAAEGIADNDQNAFLWGGRHLLPGRRLDPVRRIARGRDEPRWHGTALSVVRSGLADHAGRTRRGQWRRHVQHESRRH